MISGLIVALEPENNRIKVGRRKTDIGAFVDGDSITGQTSEIVKVCSNQTVASGTGADIYAYSTEIGGVGSPNIINQERP